MYLALGELSEGKLMGSVAAAACLVVGYVVWRNLYKHREQRREYRERERQRRRYWGWQ